MCAALIRAGKRGNVLSIHAQLHSAQEQLKQSQAESAKAKADVDEMAIENEVRRAKSTRTVI